MTCIVGLVHKGDVWMGGDAAACNYERMLTTPVPKVFRLGEMLIGYTTSFRMGDILQHGFTPPEHPTDMDVSRYLVTSFIPALIAVFKAADFHKAESGRGEGGNFLLGYRGALYDVGNDYQCRQIPPDECGACGSGYMAALGALFMTRTRPPRQRLITALEAAAHLTPYVRPPFTVLRLKGTR